MLAGPEIHSRTSLILHRKSRLKDFPHSQTIDQNVLLAAASAVLLSEKIGILLLFIKAKICLKKHLSNHPEEIQ